MKYVVGSLVAIVIALVGVFFVWGDTRSNSGGQEKSPFYISYNLDGVKMHLKTVNGNRPQFDTSLRTVDGSVSSSGIQPIYAQNVRQRENTVTVAIEPGEAFIDKNGTRYTQEAAERRSVEGSMQTIPLEDANFSVTIKRSWPDSDAPDSTVAEVDLEKLQTSESRDFANLPATFTLTFANNPDAEPEKRVAEKDYQAIAEGFMGKWKLTPASSLPNDKDIQRGLAKNLDFGYPRRTRLDELRLNFKEDGTFDTNTGSDTCGNFSGTYTLKKDNGISIELDSNSATTQTPQCPIGDYYAAIAQLLENATDYELGRETFRLITHYMNDDNNKVTVPLQLNH